MHWRIEQFIRNRRVRRAQRLERKVFALRLERPIVTFTFDDFPRSALTAGAPILERHGVQGTYYVSMGSLAGAGVEPGDLRALVAGGHDLGCHTYGHLDCWQHGAGAVARDIERNQDALQAILPGHRLEHFAYPHTHATPAVKRHLGERFLAARGGHPRINAGEVDLNLLGAFTLFASCPDQERIRTLLARNDEQTGWLIFITHDVSDSPSPYGCTPAQLSAAVRLAVESGACVLSCRAALEKAGVGQAVSGSRAAGRTAP